MNLIDVFTRIDPNVGGWSLGRNKNDATVWISVTVDGKNFEGHGKVGDLTIDEAILTAFEDLIKAMMNQSVYECIARLKGE